MPQPPVRKPAIVILDDRGQSDPQATRITQLSHRRYAHCRLKLELIIAPTHRDFRSLADLGGRHSLPIGTEPVDGPVKRWREIEFVVAGRICRRDEDLEARVLPKGLRPSTRPGGGN